jgi:hypothetical protein
VGSGGKRRNAPRAPSQSFFFLHDADHPGYARADPQPSAAEATTPQHTPEAAVPGATSERRQDPRTGHELVALPPASRAYKNPPSTSQKTHTLTATNPHTYLFLSPSEMSDHWEQAPPRSRRLRPPLELMLVRGGGAEPPPSICYPAIKFCFLSVTPSPSNSCPCKRR